MRRSRGAQPANSFRGTASQGGPRLPRVPEDEGAAQGGRGEAAHGRHSRGTVGQGLPKGAAQQVWPPSHSSNPQHGRMRPRIRRHQEQQAERTRGGGGAAMPACRAAAAPARSEVEAPADDSSATSSCCCSPGSATAASRLCTPASVAPSSSSCSSLSEIALHLCTAAHFRWRRRAESAGLPAGRACRHEGGARGPLCCGPVDFNCVAHIAKIAMDAAQAREGDSLSAGHWEDSRKRMPPAKDVPM